ncbi:MAG: APC family permease, partial [Acidimicrobiales bacterium]
MAQVADFEANDRKLKQALGPIQLLMLSLGAIIGSGWLFAVLSADSSAGGASVVSWVVGGILVLFIALSYSEVAAMLPRSGAVVRYPHLTHGGFAGFILGWAYVLASSSVPAIEAIATVQYLAPHTPANWQLLSQHANEKSLLHFPEGFLFTLFLLLVFFFINVVGARFMGRFNSGVMIWKLGIPILTFIFLFALSFHASNLTAGGGFAALGTKKIFEIIPGAGIVFSFLGFRQALDYGGEARRPQRDIPMATILSVLVGIVIYSLLQLSFTGGINWGVLHLKVGDWAGLGKLTTTASSPFYAILKSSGVGFLGAFAAFLLADAVVSPTGTGYVYLGTGGRTIFGMGTSGYFPSQVKAIGRTRVPWVALLASLVVAVLFTIPSKSWYGLVGFITSATVFTYIMGGVGIKVLRRTAPDLARPFRLGLVNLFGPLSFLAAVVIVFWSGFVTDAALVAAVFLGLPLFSWFYMVQKGWLPRMVAYPLGAVFAGAWIVLQWWGHWVLSTRSATNAALHAPFPLWIILCAVAVFGFAAVIWVFAKPEGKRVVNSAWWLLCLLFGEFCLTRYSSFGPNPTGHLTPLLRFPYDTIWALVFGLIMYVWAVYSGYATEELRAITETGTGLIVEEVPTPRPAGRFGARRARGAEPASGPGGPGG